MRIRRKLQVTLLALLLVPLAVVSLYALQSIERYFVSAAQEELHSHAITVAGLIRTSLAAKLARAEDFASDGFIRSRLARLQTIPAARYNDENALLLTRHLQQNKLVLDRDLRDIHVINSLGIVVADTDLDEIGETQSGEELRIRGIQETYLVSAFNSEIEGVELPHLGVATPITDLADGKIIGALINLYDYGFLDAALKNVKAHRHRVTEGGSDGIKVEGWIFDDERRPLVANSLAGTDSALLATSLYPLIEWCRDHNKGVISTFEHPGQGVVWAAGACIDTDHGRRWTVVLHQPAAAALGPLRTLQGSMLGLAAIMTWLGWLTAQRTAYTIAEPIEALRKGAGIIGSGQLNHRVATNINDEVGDLSRAIDAMSENLQKITASRDELEEEITARQTAEAALALSEKRYHGIFEQAPIAIAMLDHDGLCVDGNPMFHTLMGRENEDSEPVNLFDHPAIIAAGLTRNLVRLLHAGIPFSQPAVNLLDPATHKPLRIEVRAVPILLGNEINGGIILFEDTTELDQLTEELESAALELARSNQELGQFAYIASHDLQEPLRMISSYLQLLERRYKPQLDQDAREFIDYAVDGARRLQAMIQSLLEYSRIETRGEPLAPIALQECFEEARKALAHSIRDRQAEIVCDDLPRIRGDRHQMVRLLQNLIGNGIKYTGDRTPRIEVRAMALAQVPRELLPDGVQLHSGWLIIVADNGIGIAPEHHERIFNIFQRLHGRGEYEGTGIGLSICRRIVERHGGQIWLRSTAGNGSTFYFTLPYPAYDKTAQAPIRQPCEEEAL